MDFQSGIALHLRLSGWLRRILLDERHLNAAAVPSCGDNVVSNDRLLIGMKRRMP
jgi:hypothetical protein